ncbi:FecCD family ABC transporter permease [Rummeliibacillus suwonensis]|uniref:FecCD family ABC transporter permease n=1 Tax=Rummeliibacillus suwonensis TaxID=1306154 RepID=UPI001AAEFD0E|nr:iron ABC transporter permease [Rummeliibacillus suwonensis]MBO2537299.1 iron ABC transporter permease [Rummeliibacillus suwonensis]
MRNTKFALVCGITFLAIIIFFFVSMNAGFIHIPLQNVLSTLFGHGTEEDHMTIFQFRLPRIILAILIGAGMAVAGAILQGASRNPLADPGILGINAGAGFVVVLYMFLGRGTSFLATKTSVFIMPFAAFFGALCAACLIYALAWKKGRVTPSRLLLVGIGVNAAFNSGITILQMKMEPTDFTKALVWLSGTIWSTSWQSVWTLCIWLLILLLFAFSKAYVLEVLNLGDPIAIGLGTNVERERRLLLIIAVAIAGGCVAVGGGITFLGLIAPHMAKMLVGSSYRKILPLSALIGSLLLLLADTLGRVIIAPAELPVGIVISILGVPYFVYLLLRKL